MRRTCRFGYRSLIAPSVGRDPHARTSGQPLKDAGVPRRALSRPLSVRAQRTVARAAAAMLMVALLCTPAALADELWGARRALDPRGGLPRGRHHAGPHGRRPPGRPLAPTPAPSPTSSTVPVRRRPPSSSTIRRPPSTGTSSRSWGRSRTRATSESFDPLLRSTLRTVSERGFPARLADYTADLRTMDLAQYDRPSAVRAPVAVLPAGSAAARRRHVAPQAALPARARVPGGVRGGDPRAARA